jgi:hypothetical protein
LRIKASPLTAEVTDKRLFEVTYQELLVTSLTACHTAGATAPLGLLDHLAAFALSAFPGHEVAPHPWFVLRALERELTQRSVAYPHEAARVILPGIDGAFT